MADMTQQLVVTCYNLIQVVDNLIYNLECYSSIFYIYFLYTHN